MADAAKPIVAMLAGPNGAGKSTIAPLLLGGAFAEYVNADAIARGLSAFHPEAVAIEAGRLMLRRLQTLAEQRASFAFETTLASRNFAVWIRKLVADGYEFRLLYLFLRSADVAVARVAERVHAGGHAVPEDVIRRRYRLGLRNLFDLYIPLAADWQILDNSIVGRPRAVAAGGHNRAPSVFDQAVWEQLQGIPHDT